ncbi:MULTISPECIES: pyrimidine reductase family protein [unclassified Nocardioides]|uniref:pyrimidine reductase family protein n=1 Tax=unclassified Nocardioides TaxID=2615069 RepID=UPI00116EA092|nr:MULTISPECIES: pyrimidine reductase family protein [unclassified Nocardioides]TQK69684.1 riboflavin biosynthesis pyrimidine reductase [Nocardioides sp. SLBN-35]WGY01081.1 pyrimidine reductase family protein [Nocardioides sp. QY071]
MRILESGPETDDPLTPYLAVDRSRPRHECWVTGHMVAGLDGTAARAGRVGAMSTDADQVLFRRMRQIADVVLVGAQTVRREGYGPVRLAEEAQAARVLLGQQPVPPVAVVSRSLDLDWDARVFAEADSRTYVITCSAADPERVAAAGQVASVVVAGEERVDPACALRALAALGHRVVLCEGGPQWLGEMVAADRLDELLLSVSPVIGGDPLPVCVNPPGAELRRFRLGHAMVEDDALFLRYERAGGHHE